MNAPDLTVRRVRFDNPRPLTDWIEDGRVAAGYEQGGIVLPPMALDAIARSRTSGDPCELVVTGEEWYSDGRHYLVFAASRDHIEAVSDYRHKDHALHYVCPECTLERGQHARGCPRKAA